MDDSGGSTGVVVTGALDLLANVFKAGKKEVFDFLLKEIKKTKV
ncbi:hypothetical protein [Thermodesulfatator autotrophicus]|nr:hypothetical protein [Thermodesulfatator autotrophicus]